METNNLLIYYIVKRLFLFLDEWLFYYTLYKLVKIGYYKLTMIVLFYGLACIYTSYTNIDRIETNLTGINQIIFLTNYSLLDCIKNFRLTS